MSRRKRKGNNRKRGGRKQQNKPKRTTTTVIVSPPATNHPEAAVGNSNGHNSDGGKMPKTDSEVNWEWWFAAALVFVGCTQSLFSVFQWNEMATQTETAGKSTDAALRAVTEAKRANDIAADTETKQLRAWVGIDGALLTPLADKTTYLLELTIKNYGQTPAYNVIANVSFEYLPPPFEVKEILGSTIGRHPPSRTLLGPGATVIHKERKTITAENLQLLQNTGLQLQIAGYIIYDDAFKKHHCGSFRFQWGGRYNTTDLTWDHQSDCDESGPK